LGVLLAFSMAEPVRPIADHWLAFFMTESGRMDERTDGFSSGKSRGQSLSFLWFFALRLVCSGFLLCAWVPNKTLGLLWKRRGGEGDEGNIMKSIKRREVS
jgi:hypothetical protein